MNDWVVLILIGLIPLARLMDYVFAFANNISRIVTMYKMKYVLFSLLFITFSSSHAAIIEYGSYKHDTDTDIVVGNGLEWLQWDRTVGMSMNDVIPLLDTLEGGGWQIASNTQMASLFNNFNFGFIWDSNEQTDQIVSNGFGSGWKLGTEPYFSFVSMFGDTYASDGTEGSYAFFGEDLNKDGWINQAYVEASPSNSCGNHYLDANARMSGELRKPASTHYCYGVALTRSLVSVPEPSIFALMLTGIFGLGIARRRMKG